MEHLLLSNGSYNPQIDPDLFLCSQLQMGCVSTFLYKKVLHEPASGDIIDPKFGPILFCPPPSIYYAGSFPFVPPSTLCDPQVQSTCHYMVNHYVKICHVRRGCK